MDCDFLLRWPSLQALCRARPSTLNAFWAAHGSRSEKRLEVVANRGDNRTTRFTFIFREVAARS